MQSWIILESSATAFFIWTRGEPVQIRWRTNTMKNKYKARGASMLPSLWRALSCRHRHGWGSALYHDHHEQEVSPENDVMAAQSQAAAAWRGDRRSDLWFCPGRRVGAYHRRHDGQEDGEHSEEDVSENYRGPRDKSRVSRSLPFVLEDQDWPSSWLVTTPSPPWTSNGLAPGTRLCTICTWPSAWGTPRTEGEGITGAQFQFGETRRKWKDSLKESALAKKTAVAMKEETNSLKTKLLLQELFRWCWGTQSTVKAKAPAKK